jgi:nucleoside-diphosphate-sugar epimerase
MKYVVTGGAGFVGKNIVKILLEQDDEVVVVDNLVKGSKTNLETFLPKIKFIQEDIRNFSEMEKILKNIDGVFHQAALTVVQESYEKTDEYYDVNVKGTENIFKLAKKNNFKVVYASSSSVYGNQEIIPIKENAKRNPINPYGKTKLEDEILYEKYSKMNTSIIGLRYFNIYGIGQNLDYAGVITKFLDRIRNNLPPIIFGDGSQIRDFVFVEDIANANIITMKSNIKNLLVNVGTGKKISIKELAEYMIKIADMNTKPIYKKSQEGDIKSSVSNMDLFLEKFNWKPEKRLEDWLNQIIAKN